MTVRHPASRGDIRFGTIVEVKAIADGTTDVSKNFIDAIKRASDAGGGDVIVPPGDYFLNAGLVIDADGVRIIGAGGHTGQTTLTFGHTTGDVACIRIKKRSCGAGHMRITSDATRFAATVNDGHGIWVEHDDVAQGHADASSLSRNWFEDLDIRMQPEDGFNNTGGAEMIHFDRISATDCDRHGIVFDRGDVTGRTNKDLQAFQSLLINARAIECGGNGIYLGINTANITMINPEALGCCWNSGTRASLYAMETACRALRLIQPDIEDQQYAATTSGLGNTRTGNATPSEGIIVRTNQAYIYQTHASSLLSSIELVGGVDNVHIDGIFVALGAYSTKQTAAVTIANGNANCSFRCDSTQTTAGADSPLLNQDPTTEITIDGQRYRGTALSTMDYEIESEGVERTIASGTLTIGEDVVWIKGESDTTDSVTVIRIDAGGTKGYNGMTLRLINRSAYTITLVHGSGIELRAGANLGLTQYQGVTLVYSETGTSWIEV